MIKSVKTILIFSNVTILNVKIIVFGKTEKVFMMDIEQGHFVIELDNNGFKVGVEQYQLFLASKDSLLYFRG